MWAVTFGKNPERRNVFWSVRKRERDGVTFSGGSGVFAVKRYAVAGATLFRRDGVTFLSLGGGNLGSRVSCKKRYGVAGFPAVCSVTF